MFSGGSDLPRPVRIRIRAGVCTFYAYASPMIDRPQRAGAPGPEGHCGGAHPRLFVSGQFSSLVKFTSDEVKR